MGRLSNEAKQIPPQFTDIADEWMKQISINYETNRKKFYKMCRDMHYNIDEDVFSETVLMCYDSISRNGLEDLTQQGCENYLFKAFRTNMYAKSSYDKRKVETNVNNFDVEDKTNDVIQEQLYKDFSIIYILNVIENNFDNVSFNLWRLKNLGEKMTYEKLRNITKIKDCKKRIIDINNWLKDNISKKEIYDAFQEYCQNNLDVSEK